MQNVIPPTRAVVAITHDSAGDIIAVLRRTVSLGNTAIDWWIEIECVLCVGVVAELMKYNSGVVH
jgi:hypothetical protein